MLNELKTRTLNEERLERETLQCHEMLQHLKVTNGHATRNVLKRRQSLIDGVAMSTTSTQFAQFATTFEKQNSFLVGKVDQKNEWKREMKIQNLKKVKNLGVMTKEEFKLKVRAILNCS
jgi:hypothetical protein